MEAISRHMLKGGHKSSTPRAPSTRLRVLVLAVVVAGLFCLVRLFDEPGRFTSKVYEKVNPVYALVVETLEPDVDPIELERLENQALTSNEPLYPVMFQRDEMSRTQRRQLLQEVVDRQLSPYVQSNKTYTRAQIDKLKRRNNFAMRVIKNGHNLTVVQTEQEKDNWDYWYRMDQTFIAFKSMYKLGMLPEKLDLVINLNDEPNMSQRDFKLGMPPLFSYCSTARNYDLVWIGWQYWRCLSPRHWEEFQAGPDCQDPWRTDDLVLEHPWASRIPQALWRGSPTGRRHTESNWRGKPRPVLAMLSRNHSDILNCTLSECQEGQCTEEAVEEMKEELGFAESLLTHSDYLRHKYLVDVDGNSFSSRFPTLLSTGSLVFKQDSHYEEFLDYFFQPGRHYVKVEKDFKNLVEKVRYAISHDREAELIAARSAAMLHYIVEHDVVFEYLQLMIEGYMRLVKWDS